MTADTDKDLPLKEDTRFLGRVLGDVLRAQTGDDGYGRVEAIRQAAVRFHRAASDEARSARDELDAMFAALPVADVLHVVRAFSYFSLLANIAEDGHQIRRRRENRCPARRRCAGTPRARCSPTRSRRAASAATALRRLLARVRVSPVLTAHPTEVQRKSTLDMPARDRRAAERGATART